MDDGTAELIMAVEGQGFYLRWRCECTARGHRVEGHTRTQDAAEVQRTRDALHACLLAECLRLRHEAFGTEPPSSTAWTCAACGAVGPESTTLPAAFRFTYVRSRGGGFARRVVCNRPGCARAFGGYSASPTREGGEGN